MEAPPDERALVQKLVNTWHLNVPERRALPAGKARASLVMSVIEEALWSEGWFPAGCRPDDEFNGGLIEARGDGSCRLYWKAEVAMSRYELVGTQELPSTRAAAEAFAKRSYGPDIDGVPLDWSA